MQPATKENYSNHSSRFHRTAKHCNTESCCERYIFHAAFTHPKCGSKLLEASSSGHSNALPVAMKQMPYAALGKLIVVIGLKQVNLNQE